MNIPQDFRDFQKYQHLINYGIKYNYSSYFLRKENNQKISNNIRNFLRFNYYKYQWRNNNLKTQEKWFEKFFETNVKKFIY